MMIKRQQEAVDTAVRVCLADPDAAPVMHDLLEDAQVCWPQPRQGRYTLVSLVSLARGGTAAGREAVRWARGLIESYVGHVWIRREVQETWPEMIDPEGGFGTPTIRETEGDGSYRRYALRLQHMCRHYALTAEAHVRRLVIRGLCGEDVPPDVGREIMDLVEEIRACFLLPGTMHGRRAPWEEGVRA